MEDCIRVDVVIPAFRPDGRLNELLKRLKKQDYPVNQIYIINTRSGEFPADIEQMTGVKVLHIEPEEFDHGGTRNKGCGLSDAEVVVFMTQDAVPADKKLIGELVRSLYQSDRVAVSYARQLPAKDCDHIERYTRSFNYPEVSRIKGKEDMEELGIKTFFCSDVCAAYKREIHEKMGGFSEKTIFNEDMILAGQMVLAGYQVVYAAKARVIHSHNYSGIQQFHRNFDLGVSQAEHPEIFSAVHSESEGIRLVKKTILYLWKTGKPWLIPVLIYKSGCKYLGYKLGVNYRKLPVKMVKWCSMSKKYWNDSCKA